MAVNGASNVEDADMAECDDEKVVTMMDVLQEQKDFEDDANAVLGASDDKNCTYSKGYIKRQAIYACLTCCSEAKDDPSKRAGVCLACSLNCHENHELIELYTKRNFRCDCGNPKFNTHPCYFTVDKSDLNDDNKYNQNFSGLYCNCHRPYPDPESTVEDDEMIQCIVCEDWLHSAHLDAVVPGNDQYSEMICKACMENNEFLHDYSNLAVNVETEDVDVIAVNGTNTNLSNGDLEIEKFVNGTGDLLEDTTKEPKNDMDVDEAQTDNHKLEKSVEENKVNENDVQEEAEKTDDTSHISSDVNADSKDDTNTAITSEDSASEKESDDTLEVLSSDTKESSKPQESDETPLENAENTEPIQEPEETKETEDKVEDMPESENFDNNSENSEAKDDATEITLETSNGHELEKLNSKDSDENNVIQTATENSDSLDFKEPEENNVNQTSTGNDDSLHSKEPEENKNIQTTTKEDDSLNSKNEENNVAQTTTENDDSRVDTKTNDIDMSDAKAVETENTDVAKDESSTNKNDNTETDKLSTETASESEISDSLSKVDTNEIPKDVNSDEPAVNKIGVSNETVNGTEEVTEKTDEIKENKRKFSIEETIDDNFVKKRKLDEESICTRPKNVKRVHKGATFWPSNFRQKLCTCNECLTMYKDLSVLFLLDSEDTVMAYEILGKEMGDGRATQYEKGLEALSSLGRIQQINALTEYNKMKDKLLDFLKSFKDRKEVVKEEDIKAFFAGMKPKREPDGVYFCR